MPFVKLDDGGGASGGLKCLRDRQAGRQVREVEQETGLGFAFQRHGCLGGVSQDLPRFY